MEEPSGGKLNLAAVHAMADGAGRAENRGRAAEAAGAGGGAEHEEVQLTLETALSLRQKGYFLTPEGRMYSSEGDMTVETANGLVYSLRFGEVAAGDTKSGAPSDNRHLFVMAHFDAAKAAAYGGDAAAGERAAKELNDRFADWYYVISGKDFQNLRLGRGPSAQAKPASPPAVTPSGEAPAPPRE